MQNDADEDRPGERNQDQVADRSDRTAAGAFGRETYIQVERGTEAFLPSKTYVLHCT
jgi:hypothetical protein